MRIDIFVKGFARKEQKEWGDACSSGNKNGNFFVCSKMSMIRI